MAVSIPKDQLENVNEVDSRISAVYDPEQTFPNGDLIGLYGSRGKGFAEISSISLYDSGEFVFSFSPLSSYIGHGSYTLEDDRLVLQTEDGVFTYEFDVVNGNLVFDADASSSMVWYSGMTDGSVFLAEPVP